MGLLGLEVSRQQIEVPVHCGSSRVCNTKKTPPYIFSQPDIFSVNSLIMRSKLISLGALIVKKKLIKIRHGISFFSSVCLPVRDSQTVSYKLYQLRIQLILINK